MDLIVAACLASMGTQAEADRAVELALLSRPSICAECETRKQSTVKGFRVETIRLFDDRPRIQNLRARFFNVVFFPVRAARWGFFPRVVNDG